MKPSGHLSPDEERAIGVFVKQLLAEFGQDVTDVRLFGSKARGEAGPDSDVDILVLVKRSDYALKHAILWLAAEVSLAHDVLLSPRLIPLTAWQKMGQADTLFYRTVCAEDIPLLTPTRRLEHLKTLTASCPSRFTLHISRFTPLYCGKYLYVPGTPG
jgi:predicted nucleotidyltransferase